MATATAQPPWDPLPRPRESPAPVLRCPTTSKPPPPHASSSSLAPAPQKYPPPPPFLPHRSFPPPLAQRDFTVLKEVGDGSFGTVWLADWHSELTALPPGTLPPGPSGRPEYKGKNLVAIKRMKKAFEGGWDECLKLKELKSLRQIPMHPNIIPLYDAFLLPSTKELYFVFECMEGNLYQLTKSRKGRPLASGLTASIFYQILAGLHHIHQSGYFHRDMKPENLLITTTGLADYPASSLYAPPAAAPEKDVVVVVKLADFGLARETNTTGAILTEYVSTRWYRAPEVLLRSRDYSNPVDMWALGTILVEVITLKPLFPGDSEVDQVYKICEVLGDPSPEYGIDERGRVKGGGPWARGVKMAKEVGFAFPKMIPKNLASLFDANTVPSQLVDCIADLLRFEPKARLTTQECLDHPYFHEVAYRFAPYDAQSAIPSPLDRRPSNYSLSANPSSQSPREIPPSHSNGTPSYQKPAFSINGESAYPPLPPADSYGSNGRHFSAASSLSRNSKFSLPLQPPTSEDSAMSYQENERRQARPSSRSSSIWSGQLGETQWGGDQRSLDFRPIPAFGSHQGRRGSISESVAASTFYDGSIFEGIAPSRASSIMSFPASYNNYPDSIKSTNYSDELSQQLARNGLHNPGAASMRSPQSVTSNNLELPPFVSPQQARQQQQQQQLQVPAPPPNSKSRSWSFSSVFRPDAAGPPPIPAPASNQVRHAPSTNAYAGPSDIDLPRAAPLDPKKAKKEAEKLAKEAEKVKREAMQMVARERARAVMRKKSQLMEAADPLNNYSNQLRAPTVDKGKARATGSSANLASVPHGSRMPQIVEDNSRLHVSEMRHKTRRRDEDDDVHSVSSGGSGNSSQRGGRPFSISSQATSASEPDIRSRHRNGGLSRNSISSIGSHVSLPLPHPHLYGGRAPSTGHSSLDHQLIDDFSGLATSGDDGLKSPVRTDSRGHRGSPGPREPAETRFSPYPPYHSSNRPNGHTLPAIDHAGHLRHPPPSSSASIASFHSTPGALPSHYDLPFLPSMLDSEGNIQSSTFPYNTNTPAK